MQAVKDHDERIQRYKEAEERLHKMRQKDNPIEILANSEQIQPKND